MFKIKVQHYGEQAQVMDTFKRKPDADRYLVQQAEIAKGYEKSVGFLDGQMIVFGEEGIFKTRMWVAKCSKTNHGKPYQTYQLESTGAARRSATLAPRGTPYRCRALA